MWLPGCSAAHPGGRAVQAVSFQCVPHCPTVSYCTAPYRSIRVDALSKLRAQLNETLAAGEGGKLSLNDFVIKVRLLCLLHALPAAHALPIPCCPHCACPQ